MAIAFRSSSYADGNAGLSANLTAVEPAGAAAGDVFVAFFVASYTGTETPPSGWTTIYAGTIGFASGYDYWVGYVVRSGSAPSLTWTTWASNSAATVQVLAFSGVDSASPIDASAQDGTGSGSASPPDCPSATSVTANALAIAMGCHFAGVATSWTAPTGYTLRGTNTHGLASASKALGAAGAENPAAFGGTPNGADAHNGVTIILKPALNVTRALPVGALAVSPQYVDSVFEGITTTTALTWTGRAPFAVQTQPLAGSGVVVAASLYNLNVSSAAHSYMFATSGLNRGLVVGVWGPNNGSLVITYAGVSVPLVIAQAFDATYSIRLYYLTAPASGTHTMAYAGGSSQQASFVLALTGVAQVGNPESYDSLLATASTATTALVPVKDNASLVGFCASGTAWDGGTHWTTQVDDATANVVELATYGPITPAASTSMTAGAGSGANNALAMMVLAPAPGYVVNVPVGTLAFSPSYLAVLFGGLITGALAFTGLAPTVQLLVASTALSLGRGTVALTGLAPSLATATVGPLGVGDLTTAFLAWLKAQGFTGDVNTQVRDYLATLYSSGENEDLGTLVARFDDHNRES